MTRVYYKEAVAAIIVFDITNRKTFGAVDVWLKDVNEKLNLDSNREPVPIMLLANKADLLKERPACIEDSELEQFVSDNGLIGYFKTSAKDNDQIADAMKFLVGRLREEGTRQNDRFPGYVFAPSTPAPFFQQRLVGTTTNNLL